MCSEVEALKVAFSSSTNSSEWATLAVFVGLVGDIAVILIFDFFDEDKSWWEIILAGVASLVIATGVWGEWHFGHLATQASGRLQSISEERIAVLNAEAAQLNKSAETARLETARIKKELAWRNLTKEQKEKITSAVRPFVGLRADVFWYAGDPEAENFGNQIMTLLKSQKWDVGSGAVVEYGRLLSGACVEIGSPTQEVKGMNVVRIALTPTGQKAADNLAKSFRIVGLSALDTPKKMIPWDFERIVEQGVIPISEAPVRVMVGVKPR